MKNLALQIRRMPEERLKEFEKGRWSIAWEVSYDNFNTYYKVSPMVRLGDLIENIKIREEQL